MDNITTSDLRSLMAHRVAQCVSIYLPTHPAGLQSAQDAVRLKNLVERAESLLESHGMRAPEARELVRRVRELPQDELFWMQRSQGLALFISSESFLKYRLPYSFDEEVQVNRRFHVKPLLPLLSGDVRYFVLVLNQTKPRLLRGSRYGVEAVEVATMPGPIGEALNYVEADRGSQVHSAARGGVRAKQGGVFHGQGGIPDTAKDELAQYLRLIDQAVQAALRGEKAPLVLVGVDYVIPMFRSVCRYAQVLPEAVPGNAEHWGEQTLHEKSWPIVERVAATNRQEAAARFLDLLGTGKASDNLSEIVPASAVGKVECLLLDPQARQWGAYDAHNNKAEIREAPWPGDEDLIDFAAFETLNNRGSVFTLPKAQMPTKSSVAALFRY